MTVDELIKFLEKKDRTLQVMLISNEGFTLSGVCEDDIDTVEISSVIPIGTNESRREELKKWGPKVLTISS